MTWAWIDWSRITHCKRWFSRTKPEDKNVWFAEIVEKCGVGGDKDVYYSGLVEPHRTTMSSIVKNYEEEGELPLPNTYIWNIWNEKKNWVIEVPVINWDQDYSINFGYSNADCKETNDEWLARVRGKR